MFWILIYIFIWFGLEYIVGFFATLIAIPLIVVGLILYPTELGKVWARRNQVRDIQGLGISRKSRIKALKFYHTMRQYGTFAVGNSTKAEDLAWAERQLRHLGAKP